MADHEGLQAAGADGSQIAHPWIYKEVNRDREALQPGKYPCEHIGERSESQTPPERSNVPAFSGSERQNWIRRKRTIAVVIAFIIVLIVVIVVPVVVTEQNRSKTNTSDSVPNGHVPESSTFSTSGAFNGTGIGANDVGDPTLVFFQHYDGSIWQSPVGGGDFVGTVIGGDIRNATPIAAITYPNGSDLVMHVAYVDSNNVLQDQRQINGSGQWEPGLLGSANLQASTSPSAGLSIVANQVDLSLKNANDTGPVNWPTGEVRLYYGAQDHLIHELTLPINGSAWRETYVFPSHIDGDAGFYVAQPQNDSFLFCSDVDRTLTWFSMQTFPNDIGGWNEGTPSTTKIRANSSVSLSFNDLVYYQDEQNSVRALGFDITRPSTPWKLGQFISEALPATRLVGTLVGASREPAVILQTSANTISRFTMNSGTWDNTTVQVD